jgi:hypothetical protein
MPFPPKKGTPGTELTWAWLNKIRAWCRSNEVYVGQNSGLTMKKMDCGTFLAVSTPPQGVYICQPGTAVSGATGTWPAITPVSFTADVYQVSGANLTLYLASATIYNWYAAGLDDDKTVTVLPDGSGSFVAIAQSCT